MKESEKGQSPSEVNNQIGSWIQGNYRGITDIAFARNYKSVGSPQLYTLNTGSNHLVVIIIQNRAIGLCSVDKAGQIMVRLRY